MADELNMYTVMKVVNQTWIQQIKAESAEEAETLAESYVEYADKWELVTDDSYFITPDITFDEE